MAILEIYSLLNLYQYEILYKQLTRANNCINSKFQILTDLIFVLILINGPFKNTLICIFIKLQLSQILKSSEFFKSEKFIKIR